MPSSRKFLWLLDLQVDQSLDLEVLLVKDQDLVDHQAKDQLQEVLLAKGLDLVDPLVKDQDPEVLLAKDQDLVDHLARGRDLVELGVHLEVGLVHLDKVQDNLE